MPKEELSGIYSIPCEVCPAKYIGQTERNFKKRKNEHLLATGFDKKLNDYNPRKLRTENSAVAVHYKNTKHKIDWPNAKIIKPCSSPHLLNINEKLHIYLEKEIMNKSDDRTFPNAWKSLVNA